MNLEKLREYIKELPELIGELNKVTEYKIQLYFWILAKSNWKIEEKCHS